MSTPTLTPDIRYELDYEDEPSLIGEFQLPAEADLSDHEHAENERERYDGQILAALVSP